MNESQIKPNPTKVQVKSRQIKPEAEIQPKSSQINLKAEPKSKKSEESLGEAEAKPSRADEEPAGASASVLPGAWWAPAP